MKYFMDIWDKSIGKQKQVFVEDGFIRNYSKSMKDKSILTLNTSQFHVFPGKVAIDNEIGEAYNLDSGMSYVKRLLLFGVSTIIYLIDIDYESESDDLLKKARLQLKQSPIDYILAVRVPLSRLTPSWVRKLKNQSVPLIIFYVHSKQEMIGKPLQRLIEAAFPVRIMFVIDFKGNELSERERHETRNFWKKVINDFRMNSFYNLPTIGEKLPLFFLKRIGLYPQKGTLESGSDADYFMYFRESEPIGDFLIPEVIVLKGKIIKVGRSWFTDGLKGQELYSTIPEKYLSIDDINRYEP